MSTTRREFLAMAGSLAALSALHPVSVLAADRKSPLFTPVRIGNLELKNRFVRAATSMYMSDENGIPQQELFDVHADLARNGVGLITTGLTYVMKEDQYGKNGTGLYDDSLIPHYRKLTENAHRHGAKIAVQLVLAGAHSDYRVDERDIMGPSAVTHPVYGTTPREMTREDIKRAIKAMADAVVRARKAGFDGVELHYAHNYLVSQFIVPYFNKRTDEYGGSIENRARFAFEMLEAIREAVGPDYPVWAKVHGNDYMKEQGMTRDEAVYVAKGLKERGITALNISGGNLVTGPYPSQTDIENEADQSYFREDAEYISRHVDIPLILTGGNRDMDVMEKVLASSRNIVAFGMARTLLAEPDLISKWARDRDVVPMCEACNGCMEVYGKGPSHCVLFG